MRPSAKDEPASEAAAPVGGRTRSFININTQFENAGDALILRELIRLASARAPIDVYLGKAPESFIAQLNVNDNPPVTAHRAEASRALIRDIAKARLRGWRCYLFLTPGAPNGEKSVKQFAIDLVRLVWLAALTAAGVRICQVGMSFENIGPRHARILRWRSRLLHVCAPREKIAFDYAQKLGIRVTGMMPDLSFNMFQFPPLIPPGTRNGIAFSFRVDKDSAIRDRLSEIVAEICDSSSAKDVLFFVAQVGRDVTFMREISELAAKMRPGQVRFIDCHRDIEQAFAIYRTCRAVLSNRLHALLPALREGAAPVALTVRELDPKISGVFESIGLSERVFDIRSVDAAHLTTWMMPIDFDGRSVACELNGFFDDLLGHGRGTPHSLCSDSEA